jgi:hypothetical protein
MEIDMKEWLNEIYEAHITVQRSRTFKYISSLSLVRVYSI